MPMWFICVNKFPNFYDAVYSINQMCTFDVFKALRASSFWVVTTCHWVTQKSRELEILGAA
jgi:hypothetical protein